MIFIVFIVAIIESGIAAGLLYLSIAKRKSGLRVAIKSLEAQLEQKLNMLEKVKGVFSLLIPISELKSKGIELRMVRENLKTERGRTTITQAELETVEGRLRELEEIDRELEASSIETKEELAIVQKKEAELTNKNDDLKKQIETSSKEIAKLLEQLQSNVGVCSQIQEMQAQMLETQEKIDSLVSEVEQGNAQYFSLKKRYDALDIEYAQLYEKFSEAEAMVGKPAAA